jgi:hypothetical protein
MQEAEGFEVIISFISADSKHDAQLLALDILEVVEKKAHFLH